MSAVEREVNATLLRMQTELDATRAKLAEAEAERDIAARYVGNLAASQARVAELTAALDWLYKHGETVTSLQRGEVIAAALASTAQGDTSALRAVCERVATEALREAEGYCDVDLLALKDAIVARVLNRSGEASEGGGA